MRDWTVVTDVDGRIKIQNFDGTVVSGIYRHNAEAIINMVAILDEIAPHLLDQMEIELQRRTGDENDG